MKSKTKKRLSRREFIGATAGAAAAIGVGAPLSAQVGGGGPGRGGAPAQDIILTNGRIHTMDARNSVVRNVTIRNGRFVTVSDAAPARTPGARVIDLKGRTVVPGLI